MTEMRFGAWSTTWSCVAQWRQPLRCSVLSSWDCSSCVPAYTCLYSFSSSCHWTLPLLIIIVGEFAFWLLAMRSKMLSFSSRVGSYLRVSRSPTTTWSHLTSSSLLCLSTSTANASPSLLSFYWGQIRVEVWLTTCGYYWLSSGVTGSPRLMACCWWLWRPTRVHYNLTRSQNA